MKYATFALGLSLFAFAAPANAQEIIVPAAPVVTYYSPAPVVSYYAPAPVVPYYAPAVVPAYGYYPVPYAAPRWVYRRAARWGW